MYAIIQVGTHQYKVQPGDTISIQKVDAPEDSEIRFNDVIFLGGSDDEVKTTDIKASVVGKIVDQTRGEKIRVFKKKRRKGFEKTIGHRQYYTTVEIERIEA
jgi:large subunit ribosomal protein L21